MHQLNLLNVYRAWKLRLNRLLVVPPWVSIQLFLNEWALERIQRNKSDSDMKQSLLDAKMRRHETLVDIYQFGRELTEEEKLLIAELCDKHYLTDPDILMLFGTGAVAIEQGEIIVDHPAGAISLLKYLAIFITVLSVVGIILLFIAVGVSTLFFQTVAPIVPLLVVLYLFSTFVLEPRAIFEKWRSRIESTIESLKQ